MSLRASASLGATSSAAARWVRLLARRLLGFTCALVFIFLPGLQAAPSVFAAANGHAAPSLEILSIDAREFPLIRAEVKPLNLPAGEAPQINAASISILENENAIPARDVQENYAGIHFALAVNPDFALDSRDPKGVSRYTKLVGALKQMSAEFSSDGNDRFSLFINPDYDFKQLSDFSSLVTALDAYSGSFRGMKSDLASLNRAIDALSTDASGKDKALLYITGLPTVQDAKSIKLLTETAREKKIIVYVWLAGESFIDSYHQVPYLRDLAESSGGQLVIFSGSEPLPEAGAYVRSLGRTYSVSYLSLARKSGSQNLTVRLQTASGQISSAISHFTVEVTPASLSFLGLPEEISLRQSPDGSLTPSELPVEVLIDFTDGHPRSIALARLLVNGTPVQENDQAPFGSFTLALKDFSNAGKLSLQVLMIDTLGLEARSATADVNITKKKKKKAGGLEFLKSPWFLVIAGAALAVFFALVVLPAVHKAKPKAAPDLPAEIKLPALMSAPTILATLTRLNPENLPSPDKPIAITQEITIIGRDSDLCNLVLDDPAVEPMHCQIRRMPDGIFRLTDFRSSAGTWVNYAPIGVKGIRLQHGDLIQLGSLTFRFASGTRVAASDTIQLD